MRKLAFFDFDNTLYGGYTYGDFINYMCDRVLHDDQYKRQSDEVIKNNKDYNQIVKGIVNIVNKLMKGITQEEFAKYCKASCSKAKVLEWANPVLSYLKSQGFKNVIVSASFHEMMADSFEILPIDKFYCTIPQKSEKGYTGKLEILQNDLSKAQAVGDEIANDHAISIAFGDSMGDAPMLDACQLAFLVRNQKQEDIKIAKANGWILSSDANSIIQKIREFLKNQ